MIMILLSEITLYAIVLTIFVVVIQHYNIKQTIVIIFPHIYMCFIINIIIKVVTIINLTFITIVK